MILYSTEFCPFCHSCRLVLAAKALDYDHVPLDLDRKASFPEKLSPYRHVPVLVHQGRQIFESSIINEYLEEVFGDPPLLPVEPAARADVRFWVDFVQSRLVPAYFNLMNSDDPAHWPELVDRLGNWFRFLEKRAFKNTWISGDHISLADFGLYPWIERFVSAERYRGASIPEDCVALAEWIKVMKALPAVSACAKTEQQYVAFFDRYWRPLPPHRSGTHDV